MEYFDALETRSPEVRERQQMAALPSLISFARVYAPAYAELLDGIDPETVSSREALAKLPVVRKSELTERQQASRPFGGFVGEWRGRVGRVFSSPGPIYEPEGRGADYWRTARAMPSASISWGPRTASLSGRVRREWRGASANCGTGRCSVFNSCWRLSCVRHWAIWLKTPGTGTAMAWP